MNKEARAMLSKFRKANAKVNSLCMTRLKAERVRDDLRRKAIDALAGDIHDELRGMAWERSTGVGSRGHFQSKLPKRGALISALEISKHGRIALGGMRIERHAERWRDYLVVTVHGDQLRGIGVELPAPKKSRAKQMQRLLAEAGVGPDELAKMLKGRKA
jgi:hypothetical protein